MDAPTRISEAHRPPQTFPRFRAARGLGNPHAQTIGGKLLRPQLEVPLHRERIDTPDGDFLDLDFVGEPGAALDARPHVVVLHGLEGTATRRYMRTTYRALLDRGLRPVGLNFRGCSGEPNRAVRAYHSGETDDLALVLEVLRERGLGPLGVLGFSLGGNVTLKWLGEAGDEAREVVRAAAAVSVPFDLGAGADRISSGFMGRIYTGYFMRSLKRKVLAKREVTGEACDLDAVARARTIRDFDDAFTAPVHGFDGAGDYYERASAARFIDGIRVPTLVIHAMDDPFLPPDRVPVSALEANPAITALLPERGGHVGFIEGSMLRPRLWAEAVLADFMADRLPGPGESGSA